MQIFTAVILTVRAAIHILAALKSCGHAGIHNPKSREARPGILVSMACCALEMDKMNRIAGSDTTRVSRDGTAMNELWRNAA
jgi:hypothetical protein